MTATHKPRSRARGRREASLRADGTGSTCNGCGVSWTALTLAHCHSCHQSFEHPDLFDLHRRRGKCLRPQDVQDEKGLQLMIQRGDIWRFTDSEGIITGNPESTKGQPHMATIRQITKLDDLELVEGSEVAADETIEFSLDGKDYSVDLCAENAKALREGLQEFIDVATQADKAPEAKARPRKNAVKPDKEQTQAIRDWARHNGYSIADRGRIPQEVRDAYNNAS